MWKLILLFVVLTPGILFTVPRIGKTKLLAVCVHALIFVVLSQWLRVTEGFSSAIVIPVPPAPMMTRGMSQKEYDMQMQVWENNRKAIEAKNALNAKLAADAQRALNARNSSTGSLTSGPRPLPDPMPMGEISVNVSQETKMYQNEYTLLQKEFDAKCDKCPELEAALDDVRLKLNNSLAKDSENKGVVCPPGTFKSASYFFASLFGYKFKCSDCSVLGEGYYCPGNMSPPMPCPWGLGTRIGQARSVSDCIRDAPRLATLF